MPRLDTSSVTGSVDVHVATALTSWVVPSESCAVAVSWIVSPIVVREMFPATVIRSTDGGVADGGLDGVGLGPAEGGLLPQAAARMTTARTPANADGFMTGPYAGGTTESLGTVREFTVSSGVPR